MEEGFGLILVICCTVIICIALGVGAIVGSMAEKRGRSYGLWFILSLVFPLLSIIILLLLGDTDERRREKIIEEEKLRASIRNSNNPIIMPTSQVVNESTSQDLNESTSRNLQGFPNPNGKTINDLYKKN